MPALPANFFTRTELQSVITRAEAFRRHETNHELQDALAKLRDAAASVDGCLSDLCLSAHPVNKALDNPNGWSSSWFGGEITTPGTPGERFRFAYAQQILRMPCGLVVTTGRYKLTEGEDDTGVTTVTTDRSVLRATVVRYATVYTQKTPANFRDKLLAMFQEDDCNAVQEQSPAEEILCNGSKG